MSRLLKKDALIKKTNKSICHGLHKVYVRLHSEVKCQCLFTSESPTSFPIYEKTRQLEFGKDPFGRLWLIAYGLWSLAGGLRSFTRGL